MTWLKATSTKSRFGFNFNGNCKLRGAFLALLILWVLVLPAQAQYGGGSGTAEDPYLIDTAAQMNAIGADANDWDKHFKLTANIDLSAYTGETFNIIGVYHPSTETWTRFSGVFDGDGHTISNFTYSTQDKQDIGLFGIIGWDESSHVKNVHLINPNVSDANGAWVGSLVGDSAGGTVSNCSVTGGSVTGHLGVGGLCGINGGTITNCFADTTVSQGTENGIVLGGLVGYNRGGGDISGCYATGNITGYSGIGGLAGSNFMDGIITDCYARDGSVSGDHYVGGLVGDIGWDSSITNCYSAGSVSGTTDVGGLAGYNDGTGTVTNSFWDKQTSGRTTSAGGTGLMTADMQTESTFTSAGWDFTDETANGTEDIWRLCVDLTDYPRFVWQKNLMGDFLCPDGVIFSDFSFLAAHWMEENCADTNDCEHTDLDRSGVVDLNDLAIFVDNWLTGLSPRVYREDFETGDFTEHDWQHAGDANWVVVSDVYYEGSYSARSGAILDSQQSVLQITVTIENGTVSFYCKVSSEVDEDRLRFYIDDELQDNWSGEQDWSLQQYLIPSGLHTLKWSYEKDSSISSGSDCCWIDKITVTGVMP